MGSSARRGVASVPAIVSDVPGAATDLELRRDFLAFYEPLNSLDTLLLRHRSISPFPEFPLEGVT